MTPLIGITTRLREVESGFGPIPTDTANAVLSTDEVVKAMG